ncbi:MAG: MmgE/PrpD family protein [Pseudomonadota bacterium]
MKQAQPAISPLMQTLSTYIAGAARRALPAAVQERAKHHLLDTLAAMVSGAPLLPGQRAIAFAASQGGTPEAGVVGTNIVTSAINAALANGMLGHADETDDAYYLALVHPGCAVVPAALAMGERERSPGTQLLRAVTLGYDVCARTSKALGIEHFRSAGHSTHSFGGTFGAAAAAGALAGLDARQVRHLMSYAAQQASGLSCWARDVEHIEKAFDFGGMPARNGVTAAAMVSAGFSGVEDVFSGDRNFFQAFEVYAKPKEFIAGLGTRFDILQTAIKRWPVGYPIQAPLDALAHVMAKHKITAADVEKVHITVDEQGARTVNGRTMADINLQYLASVMLIDGDISFEASHDPRRVKDPAVSKLRQRIELSGSAALSKTRTTQAIAEVTTRDGRVLRHHTRAVRGSATNPMVREEVAAKAFGLLAPTLGKAKAQRLIDTIWDLEKVKDVRVLRRLLQPAAPRAAAQRSPGSKK